MSDLTKFSRRAFLVMPLGLLACKPGDEVFRLSGLTMGTSFNVVAVDATRRLREADVQKAISGALEEVNRQMSNWDPASEISRFNAQNGTDAVPVSRGVADVMQAAEYVHRASAGRFDTTMGPLIELWGFGAPGAQPMPETDAIADAQARSGHGRTLQVADGTLRKTQPDTQVYLAAIGKGYGADHVGRALESLGIKDYLVEIGGDLYASGRNPDGRPWQIGVEAPVSMDRSVLDVVGVSGFGLASSGDYRNFFEKDGTQFSHVIDPVTGRPIRHKTASATVIAENAMLADAWATAMLTLGSERGLEVAEAENLAVMFVDRTSDAADSRLETKASERFKSLTA